MVTAVVTPVNVIDSAGVTAVYNEATDFSVQDSGNCVVYAGAQVVAVHAAGSWSQVWRDLRENSSKSALVPDTRPDEKGPVAMIKELYDYLEESHTPERVRLMVRGLINHGFNVYPPHA